VVQPQRSARVSGVNGGGRDAGAGSTAAGDLAGMSAPLGIFREEICTEAGGRAIVVKFWGFEVLGYARAMVVLISYNHPMVSLVLVKP
jgi:hypothetical protein